MSICFTGEKPIALVCCRIQGSDDDGPSCVVQIFCILRGSRSAAIFPNCSIRLHEGSVLDIVC